MGVPLPQGVLGDVWPPTADAANAVVSGTFGAIGPGIAAEFWGAFNVAIWATVTTALTTTAGSNAAVLGSAAGLAVGSAIDSVLVPNGTTIKTMAGTAITMAFPTISLECQYQAGYAVLTNLPVTAGLVGATITAPGIPAGVTVTGIIQAAGTTPGGAPQTGSVTISAAPTLSSPPAGFPTGGTGRNKVLFALTASGIAAGTDAAAVFTGSGVTYVGTVELQRTFDGGKTYVTANIGGSGQLAQYSAGTPVSFIAGECERGIGYRLNCPAYTSGTINYRLSTTGQAATVLSISAGV